MSYTVNGPFPASHIFYLQEVTPVAGKPTYANLKARRLPQWRGAPAPLRGPGIYGLFCKERLFYLGLYAGANKNPFGCSVLDRWFKHLTFQSLRAPELTFVASNLYRLVNEEKGPAVDAIVVPRCRDVGTWTHEQSPLVGKRGHGACTSYHKARFAVRNWDIFAPGNEDRMLSEVSFVYVRYDDETANLLQGADDAGKAKWVKNKWLRPRESYLIEVLKPICNSESLVYRDDVGVEEFIALVQEQFDLPLAEFMSSSAPGPAFEQGDLADIGGADRVDEEEIDEAGQSAGEIRFRRRLNESGEALVTEIDENLPEGMVLGFTDRPAHLAASAGKRPEAGRTHADFHGERPDQVRCSANAGHLQANRCRCGAGRQSGEQELLRLRSRRG
ncbi:hypothetical protein [Aminobacter sp. J41]|uniref:hypothetical protein n=1 Tax=Aminobacter sp. J41 TaxID=935261 RepID=UPI000463B569|nr:hypothetical protein [Aminobacter sp. J41]